MVEVGRGWKGEGCWTEGWALVSHGSRKLEIQEGMCGVEKASRMQGVWGLPTRIENERDQKVSDKREVSLGGPDCLSQ